MTEAIELAWFGRIKMRDGSLGPRELFIKQGNSYYKLSHAFDAVGLADVQIEFEEDAMEKNGEIRRDTTPPELSGEKVASEDQLEDHVTKRCADAAKDAMEQPKDVC